MKKPKTKTKRICAICGAEFTPKVSLQKYCSPECNSRASKEQTIKSNRAAAQRPNGKTCAICGKPLHGKQIRYCSRECAAEGAKMEPSKVNRKYLCGKLRKPVKMYADIRKHNAEHPLQSGWRGQPCMGGCSARRYAMVME